MLVLLQGLTRGGKEGNIPSESVLARKQAAAKVTLVVALAHVDALVVALEVRLAHKFLGAVADGAGKGVLALVVVRLHMRLEVVAPAEELAAPLDLALEVGLFLGREPALCPPWALGLWRRGYAVLLLLRVGPSARILLLEEGGGGGRGRGRRARVEVVAVWLVPAGRAVVGEVSARIARVCASRVGRIGGVNRSRGGVVRELCILAILCRLHLDAWRGRAWEVASCARGERQPGARDGGSGSAGGRWGRSLERRRVVAGMWRLVDVVAVGVAAKGIVVTRDDTGHGRGG